MLIQVTARISMLLFFFYMLVGHHFIPDLRGQSKQKNTPFNTKEILLQTREGVVERDILKSLYPIDGIPNVTGVRRVIRTLPVFMITLDQPDSFGEAMERIKENPMFTTAHYNGRLHIRRVPDDMNFSRQWALEKIQAAKAWNYTTGTNNPDHPRVIAIIDSGFDRNHEDLKRQIWTNDDEIRGDRLDNDHNGYVDDYYGYNIKIHTDSLFAHFHGTKVAGIIGASSDNELGVAGINWDVQLMTVALGQSSDIGDDALLQGLEYVYKQRKEYNESNGTKGAYVVAVNMSLGRDGKVSTFPEICEMMDRLGEQGVLTIGATANEEKDVDIVGDLPCDCGSEYLICVTATDQKDQKVSNAAYGEKSIDLAAPGSAILSTTYSTEALYSTGSGTSYAAPMVTGAVGLLYSMPCKRFQDDIRKSPKDGAILVRDFVLSGVDKFEILSRYCATGGRLNLFNSVSLVKEMYCDQDGGALGVTFLRPNPATKHIRFGYQIAQFTLHTYRIIDAKGVIVQQASFWPNLADDKTIEVDISKLIPGTYVLQLFNDYEQVSDKFVVTH